MPASPRQPWRRRLAAATLIATLAPLPARAAVPPEPGPAPSAADCERLGFPAAANGRGIGPMYQRGVGAPPMPAPAFSPQARDAASAARMIRPLPVPPLPAVPRADTERYPHADANPVHRTAEQPVSTFSIDVDTASYSNVRRFLNDGRLPPRDAVRIEELVNYFDYGYAPPATREDAFRATVAVAPSPWSADRRIVHIGLQGYALPAAAQPPLNLVFLVDTSGSMWSADRLPLAQKALALLVEQLSARDRVAIVAYAGSAGAVLAPTDGSQKLKIRCGLESLRAGGSTAGGKGLALAYDLARQHFDREAVNRVILLTDGDFNVGISDPARLRDFVADQRKEGIYLSVYGFGRGNYNDKMMQTLAQHGNGTAAYIDTLQEARKLLRDDFAGSMFPIANDVKIQVEFNPATVAEYRLIGYETRLLKREDFNNDQVDAGEVGSGASVTALYEIAPVGAPASSDPLRYGTASQAPASGGDELAFLKWRYMLPGETASRLGQRAIGPADSHARLADAPEATRWAVAVAGFGEKLRASPWLAPTFDWRAILDLAQGARGADPFGLRAEFTTLVRAAQDARRVNE